MNLEAMEASAALKNLELLTAQHQRMREEENLRIQYAQAVQLGQMHSNSVPGPVQFLPRPQHKKNVAPRNHNVKHPKPTSAVPKPPPQEDVQKEYDDGLVSNLTVLKFFQGRNAILLYVSLRCVIR